MARITMLAVHSAILLVVCLLSCGFFTPTLQCQVATNVTTAVWHSADTWTSCTGTGGLPGVNDTVTISGEGVKITVESNQEAISVTSLIVSSARLNNNGAITTSSLTIENEAELTSDGTLSVTTTTSGTAQVSLGYAHLSVAGDLIVGASNPSSAESISAVVSLNNANVFIGGSFTVQSTEDGQAIISSGYARIKTDDTLSIIGGQGGSVLALAETELEVVSGNLALGTLDASMSVYSGPITFTSGGPNAVALHKGNLILETGSAKYEGNSGSVNINGFWQVAIAGNVIVKTGDVVTQNSTGAPSGDINFSGQGIWVLTSVEGDAESGSVLFSTGDAGYGPSAGGYAGQVYWEVSEMHMTIARDVTLMGGNGGSSNITGGAGGRVYLETDGTFNLEVGGDMTLVSGDGGEGKFGQGGNTESPSLTLEDGGDVTIKGELTLRGGTPGKGRNGGNSYIGYFYLSDSTTLTVGGDFTVTYGNGANSTGGGSGGFCEVDRKKRSSKEERGFSSELTIQNSNMNVGGSVKFNLCSGGSGLGDVGADAYSHQFYVSDSSVMRIEGSFIINGGNGGDAINSTTYPVAFPLDAGRASSMSLSVATYAILSVDGDIKFNGGNGGSVKGASGSSGAGAAFSFSSAELAAVTIGGDFIATGGKTGDIDAGSIVESFGSRNMECATIAQIVYAGTLSVGGDIRFTGCNMGSATTNVPYEESSGGGPFKREQLEHLSKAKDGESLGKRGIIGSVYGGQALVINYIMSKLLVGGNVILTGGQGGDATANNGTAGGAAIIQAGGASEMHVEGSVTLKGSSGGDSENNYGGNAGSAVFASVELGSATTGDLTVTGGNAGQGTNSSMDGEFGFGALAVVGQSQYNQYGTVKIVDGSYRDFNVSYPSSDVLFGGEFSSSHVAMAQLSQWTIYPCGGDVTISSKITSYLNVTETSTFRDCRGAESSLSIDVRGDESSDITCLGCTCDDNVLTFNECSSADLVRSAVFDLFASVANLLASSLFLAQ